MFWFTKLLFPCSWFPSHLLGDLVTVEGVPLGLFGCVFYHPHNPCWHPQVYLTCLWPHIEFPQWITGWPSKMLRFIVDWWLKLRGSAEEMSTHEGILFFFFFFFFSSKSVWRFNTAGPTPHCQVGACPRARHSRFFFSTPGSAGKADSPLQKAPRLSMSCLHTSHARLRLKLLSAKTWLPALASWRQNSGEDIWWRARQKRMNE